MYFTNQGIFEEAIRSSFDMPELPGNLAAFMQTTALVHLRAANISPAF
jgi:hypothetical protein